MWYLPEFVQLLGTDGVEDAEFGACMFGGKRLKRQRLRGNATSVLRHFHNAKCDGGHSHLPWGKAGNGFASAEEAEYPEAFCKQVAACLQQREPTAAPGATASAAVAAAKRPKTVVSKPDFLKAAVGTQPRCGKYAPVVAEYADVRLIECNSAELEGLKNVVDNRCRVMQPFAIGNGALRPGERLLEGFKKGEMAQEPKEVIQVGVQEQVCVKKVIQVGVPWDEDGFVAEAKKVVPPFNCAAVVADTTKEAIFNVLVAGPEGVGQHRRAQFEYWKKRAEELDPQERDLFAKAPVGVQACWGGAKTAEEALSGPWRGKRTLLLDEMAAAAGIRIPKYVGASLRRGAAIVGEVPASGLFELEAHEPTKTIAEVLKASRWSRPLLRSGMRPASAPGVDEEVMNRTEEEVAEGKAVGPLDEDEVSRLIGEVWAPVRRVGLVQPAGIRPIDDFSEFGHNATSKTHEKVNLEGVDCVVGVAKTMAEAVFGDRVEVRMNSGATWCGVLHEGLRRAASRQVRGRALDLKRAFKQMPIAPSMAPVSVVCIWHPVRRRPAYYVLRAMPFGARNAVFSFGAIARTLELILVRLFWYPMAQYVDDYPQLDFAATADCGVDAVEVFELLGWTVKKPEVCGVPAVPKFGPTFSALGAIYDFSCMVRGAILVRDRPDRIERVGKLVGGIIKDQNGRREAAVALRGLLGYMRAQCFGRCGAIALQYLATLAMSPAAPLAEDAKEHLLFWPAFLRNAKPRHILTGDHRPPILIWTDGAEEEGQASVGAAMLVRDAGRDRWVAFGGVVEPAVAQGWRDDGRKSKVIHQAELLPAQLALEVWAKEVGGRRVIIFVDNDAARVALVKGLTAVRPSARIVSRFWEAAAASEVYAWIDRVPSASNVADGPSRGCFAWLASKGCTRTEVPGLRRHPSEKGELEVPPQAEAMPLNRPQKTKQAEEVAAVGR